MIRNKKTGQIYIGQSKNIERRFKNHCNIPDIDKAILLEGKDSFDFIIIEETVEDKLIEREKYWIQHYNAHNNPVHYNISDGSNKHDRLINRVYYLWDANACRYDRKSQQNKNKPYRCFKVYYNNCYVCIGMFHDFVTCEIINQLIEEAIR